MQEIVFLGRNNTTLKFSGTIIVGLIISIFLGTKLDTYFQTTPIVTIIFVLYVVIGSFILLLKGIKK